MYETRRPRLGLAFAVVLVLIALAPAPLRAAPGIAGGLLLKADDGVAQAPILDTDVEIDVTGTLARVRVSQRFANPTEIWKEGIYVFPLPEDAAVDHLEMQIGDKRIVGRIEPRQQAKRTYDEAKQAGQGASLIEQERPNMFTASVANIPPGESITIAIAYQQKARWADGRFTLRLPLVVGPRYIPPLRPLMVVGGGPSLAVDPVPDAARITPPVAHPSTGKRNPVAITVALATGLDLAEVISPSHRIAVAEAERGVLRITLTEGRVPADRDFVLHWTPAADAAPRAVLFAETGERQRHLLLMLMPPAAENADEQSLPRELVFILDVSGSMHGSSIAQAKAALAAALQRLRPGDRFNLIHFNNSYGMLYSTAQAATPDRIQQALGYLSALKAEGGTRMLPALRAALDGRRDSGRLRQVVFLTDGAVGNEAELFGVIARRLGDSRLFPVGMGSAPNAHLMNRAARVGRGSYTYIGDIGEAALRMTELFRKLERPAVTGLAVEFPNGVKAEAFPDPLGDLYYGEPLVLTAALPAGTAGDVRVSGQIGQSPWQTSVTITEAPAEAGIAKLWGRDKIAMLNESLAFGADPAAVEAAVTEVALAFGLVSRHTSLVAVDVTAIRPADQPLATTEIPLNLPRGWDYDKVFGPAMKRERRAMARPTLFAAAAPAAQAPVKLAAVRRNAPVNLPQTATPAELYLLAGTAALGGGLALLVLARRRRPA